MNHQIEILNYLRVIRNKNVFFSRFILIFLVHSAFFLQIFSRNEKDYEFTAIDFYESFSSPKECFKFYHYNPTPPLFLLIDIKYYSYQGKGKKNTEIVKRKYELKLLEEPCKGSLAIKTYGKDFIDIHLYINISLYYNLHELAVFNYKFDNNFNIAPHIVVDRINKFGLEVNFLDSADDKPLDYNYSLTKDKSYLSTISKKGGFICVITYNNQQLLLWPDYLDEQRGLIISIIIHYIKNGESIFNISYPAFECLKDNYNKFEPVFLIYEGNNLDIQIKLAYVNYEQIGKKYYTFTATFINIILWNLKIKEKLPIFDKHLFCLKQSSAYLLCPNNDNVTLLISELKYFYNVRLYKDIEDSHGVIREKYFSRLPISPCM